MDEDLWGRLVAEITEQGEVAEEAIRGHAGLTVVDFGCLDCGEQPAVRGVWEEPAAGREAFDRELRRLEIIPADVVWTAVPWEDFLRAGGSACVAAAGYTSPTADGPGCRGARCGRRVLGLFITRILR